jgi:hypothetical protein
MPLLFGSRSLAAVDSIIVGLTCKPKQIRIKRVKKSDIRQFTSWLGKLSYAARLEHLGIQRIREIARENGRKGGRPPKKGKSK